MLLSVSKFVIRASLSRVHLRRRLFFKRQQRLITIIHDVNKLLGHTQIDRKSGTKSLCNVSLRVRLSCSCQNDSLAFPDPSAHHATSSSREQRQAAQFLLVLPSSRALDSVLCTPQSRSPLSTFKRKTSSSDLPILSCVSRSGNRSSRHEKSRSAPFTTQIFLDVQALPTQRVHPVNKREHYHGPPLECPWPRGV